MKQIVFISGKGGTGKSTIVATLSELVGNKMIADCDVDAPNMHLLLKGTLRRQSDYSGAKTAVIDLDKCVACGLCRQFCRFAAISDDYKVNPLHCEGCAACTVLCPTKAIELYPEITGATYVSDTEQGTFSHARLKPGAEGSGKLVTEVRKNLLVEEKGEAYTLIDGSPGIGCVVIASITGTDAVVIVSEPTLSGLHDMERVVSVARHFRVPAYVCINKYDINREITAEIEAICARESIPVLALIPFEPAVVSALRKQQTPFAAGLDNIVAPIRKLWQELTCSLESHA